MKLAVLASCIILGGGVTLSFAQETNVAPKSFSYLKKGVNLDYAFGNNYAFFIFPNDAYTPIVMGRIFSDPELQSLANSGFDHVRVPIEPFAMGASSANPAVPVLNNAGVAALVAFIARCKAVNLRVIVDFHPSIRSEAHYTAARTGYPNALIVWPGPFKKEYLRNDITPGPFHPLVQFWSTFSAAFSNAINAPVVGGPTALRSWVAFEIMNEPTFGFEPTDFEYESTNWSGFHTGWRSPISVKWRELQHRAILAGLANLPDFGFIATNCTSLPEGYRGFPYHVPGSPSYNPQAIPFQAYEWNEDPMYGPSSEGTELIIDNRIGYAAHVYVPFRYTHPKTEYPTNANPYISREPHYFLYRDFHGTVNQSEPDIPDLIEPNGTYYYKPPRGPRHPVALRFYPDPPYYNIGNWNHNEDPVAPSIASLSTWRTQNGTPKMFITEFGVTRRALYDGSVTNPHFGGGNSHQEPGAPTVGGGPRTAPDYRAQWHFDARRRLEENGMGWTVYTYRGGFGIKLGPIYYSTGSPAGITSSGDSNYIDNMVDALFGDDRP